MNSRQTRNWKNAILAASVTATIHITSAAHAQGIPMPVEQSGPVEVKARDPREIYTAALAESVNLARQRVGEKQAGQEAQQVADTLGAVGPMLRPELQAQMDDWIPLIYARFGETDQALAHVKPGREAGVPRLLLVAFEACMAKNDKDGAKAAANQILALLNASMGTLSAPGMFEAGVKVASRLGDAKVVSAIGSVATQRMGPEEASSLRVTAVRNFVADKRYDEAEKIANEMGNPLARYDAFALIAQAREAAKEKPAAAALYVAALKSLKATRGAGTPAFPPAMAAVGLYRCAQKPSDTVEADLLVLNLEPMQVQETKYLMLKAAGESYARLRIAAAFKDVLMVGEEASELGRAEEGGKTVAAWMAGERLMTRVPEVIGAAASDEPAGPDGIPGRVHQLIRAGRVLGKAGMKAKAAEALTRAADALDLIVTQHLRPDWLATVAVAQAGAGLKDESAATFTKSLEWCEVIRDQAKRTEMKARVALSQVAAGDLDGARKTAEMLKPKSKEQEQAVRQMLVIGEVWPAIGEAEFRRGNREAGEAAFKKGLEDSSVALKPIVAAGIATTRTSLGDIPAATAICKEFPTAPLSKETRTLIITALIKSGKTDDARTILLAGLEQKKAPGNAITAAPTRTPAIAERIKATANQLKEAKQFKPALEVLALEAGESPSETISEIYRLAAEAGEGAYLATHVRGEELALGERIAAITLAKNGDIENARKILQALVTTHVTTRKVVDNGVERIDLVAKGDPGTNYPAMVADGVALASIGDRQEAAKLGKAAFDRISLLWLKKEWKEDWLSQTMAHTVTLRVAARDFDSLILDTKNIDEAIRADLAGRVADELLNGTGPLAALR
jgi:hypothetical protein